MDRSFYSRRLSFLLLVQIILIQLCTPYPSKDLPSAKLEIHFLYMIEVEGDISYTNMEAVESSIVKNLSKIIDRDCSFELGKNSTIVDVFSYPRDKLSNSGELFLGIIHQYLFCVIQ